MTDDKIRLLAEAAARAGRYLADDGGPVFPAAEAIAALDGFSPALPEHPTDPAVVLDQLDHLGSPAAVRTTGGRYFGFVTGGTEPIAAAASVLAGSWDQNAALPAEIHVSVVKALRAAGIGTDAITSVPTDEAGRLRADRLPPLGPRSLVVVQAGNVNTGHSDPFGPVIEATHRADGWVHVDGAFGLWAACAPTRRHLVAGVEGADSWATDAHKWLNAPYDSGIVMCARGEDLRRAMAVDAAYLANDADRALMHLGLQMSQRARGIETWAVLATRGRSGIAELVESSCASATRLADLLAGGGAEILAPVVLNQALVAFGDDATTDAVIDAVQRDGTCWAGGTSWKGRRAMRLSVSDSSTTEADIVASAAAILRCHRNFEGG